MHVSIDPAAGLGSVHLIVRNLEQSLDFYENRLGFEQNLRIENKAHIGINTWAGVGAAQHPAHCSGLRWFTIELPDDDALLAVVDRIKAANIELVEMNGSYLLSDPSSSGILLATRMIS